MGGGENDQLFPFAQNLTGHRIQFLNGLDLIAKHLDSDHGLAPHRHNLHHIAPDPKGTAAQGHIVALVLDAHQTAENMVPIAEFTVSEGKGHTHVVFGRT